MAHAPLAKQHAPVGCWHGLGSHEVPSPKYPPSCASQSASVRTVQSPLMKQHAPVGMGSVESAAEGPNGDSTPTNRRAFAEKAYSVPGVMPPSAMTSHAAAACQTSVGEGCPKASTYCPLHPASSGSVLTHRMAYSLPGGLASGASDRSMPVSVGFVSTGAAGASTTSHESGTPFSLSSAAVPGARPSRRIESISSQSSSTWVVSIVTRTPFTR